jgi:hypothetical protein
MELTIKNPAVMDPSHIPRTRRTANNPPKLLQAAWEQRATAQIDIFKLEKGESWIRFETHDEET